MLLSPVRLNGERGRMIMVPGAGFSLARELHSAGGAPLADVFSFVSGLYFRGKAAYAAEFARAPAGQPSAFVITAGGGLYSLTERVSLARLRGWAKVAIHEDNPHFTAPLLRHATALLNEHGDGARYVLLGSVASNKYVAPLLDVFGASLLFPREFAGRGDMSRGALLLRAVRERRELEYTTVADAVFEGRRGRRKS